MRRNFAILVVLTSSCLGQTFVSSAGFEDETGTPYATVNVVFNGGVASGNAVACYVRYGNSGNSSLTVAVTGAGSENFIQAGANAEVTANSWSGLFLKLNSGGGTPYTARIAFSPANYATYVAVVCAQYSSASSLDQTAQGVNSAATGTYPYNFCTTGAFTTASPNEIIILGATGGPPYAGTGFTLRATSGVNSVAAILDKDVTSIQNSTSATVTGMSYNSWNCNLATLIKASSPAPSAIRSRSTIY